MRMRKRSRKKRRKRLQLKRRKLRTLSRKPSVRMWQKWKTQMMTF